MSTITVRPCSGCKVKFPETAEFFHRNAANGSGFVWYCKKCAYAATKRSRARNRPGYNAAQARNAMIRYNKNRPDLMRNFGITKAEYDAMVKSQKGRCAICGDPPKTNLAVDHDHTTGKIRGLLCTNCNLGMGHFRDDVDRLRIAVRYLEKNTL